MRALKISSLESLQGKKPNNKGKSFLRELF